MYVTGLLNYIVVRCAVSAYLILAGLAGLVTICAYMAFAVACNITYAVLHEVYLSWICLFWSILSLLFVSVAGWFLWSIRSTFSVHRYILVLVLLVPTVSCELPPVCYVPGNSPSQISECAELAIAQNLEYAVPELKAEDADFLKRLDERNKELEEIVAASLKRVDELLGVMVPRKYLNPSFRNLVGYMDATFPDLLPYFSSLLCVVGVCLVWLLLSLTPRHLRIPLCAGLMYSTWSTPSLITLEAGMSLLVTFSQLVNYGSAIGNDHGRYSGGNRGSAWTCVVVGTCGLVVCVCSTLLTGSGYLIAIYLVLLVALVTMDGKNHGYHSATSGSSNWLLIGSLLLTSLSVGFVATSEPSLRRSVEFIRCGFMEEPEACRTQVNLLIRMDLLREGKVQIPGIDVLTEVNRRLVDKQRSQMLASLEDEVESVPRYAEADEATDDPYRFSPFWELLEIGSVSAMVRASVAMGLDMSQSASSVLSHLLFNIAIDASICFLMWSLIEKNIYSFLERLERRNKAIAATKEGPAMGKPSEVGSILLSPNLPNLTVIGSCFLFVGTPIWFGHISVFLWRLAMIVLTYYGTRTTLASTAQDRIDDLSSTSGRFFSVRVVASQGFSWTRGGPFQISCVATAISLLFDFSFSWWTVMRSVVVAGCIAAMVEYSHLIPDESSSTEMPENVRRRTRVWNCSLLVLGLCSNEWIISCCLGILTYFDPQLLGKTSLPPNTGSGSIKADTASAAVS